MRLVNEDIYDIEAMLKLKLFFTGFDYAMDEEAVGATRLFCQQDKKSRIKELYM